MMMMMMMVGRQRRQHNSSAGMVCGWNIGESVYLCNVFFILMSFCQLGMAAMMVSG